LGYFDDFDRLMPSVDQSSLLLPDQQIHDGLFVVTWLAENKEIVSNLIDLEPIVSGKNLFEFGERRLDLWYVEIPHYRILLSFHLSG
jgi:hypothetical protein